MLGEHAYDSYLSALKEVTTPSAEESPPYCFQTLLLPMHPATFNFSHSCASLGLLQDLEQARKEVASKDDQAEAPDGFKTTVQHFPLQACGLNSATFVLPVASSAAVSARVGAHIAGLGPPDAVPGKHINEICLQHEHQHNELRKLTRKPNHVFC